MCDTLKSGNKTNTGELGLIIRTHTRPKVGEGQVSRGVRVIGCHAESVANVLWKPRGIR